MDYSSAIKNLFPTDAFHQFSSRNFVPGTQDNRVKKNEAARAMKEFKGIVEEEERRIEAIADKENKCIMKVLREKQEEVACPLCLEDLPAIVPSDKASGVMICCGTGLCWECAENWRKRQDASTTPTCFACRRPVNSESMKELVVNGGTFGKAFALNFLADDYSRGTMGMKPDFQKSLKYYERAAALDNVHAQAILMQVYATGNFYGIKVTQSKEKAREMAEQACRKGGDPNAYAFLASLKEEQYGMTDGVLHLYSLAAYQGHSTAMHRLGDFCAQNYFRLLYQTKSQEEDTTDKRRKMSILPKWLSKLASRMREE